MSSSYEKFEESLKNILNDEVITRFKGNKLEICETNSGATGKCVEISNMTNSIALELDRDNRHIYFLKDTTKINDHTIFYYKDEKLKILLIELKSRKLRCAKDQLLLGKAYADFIINILKTKNVIIKDIEFRAFIFSVDRRSARKQTTKKSVGLKVDWVENGIYAKTLANNKAYNLCELVKPIIQ
ncbi:hypothetical protein ACV311_13285 [Clostridium perfringens]